MQGTYDIQLVLISIVVAMAASYVALDLARRITATEGRTAQLWLVGGALAMGAGIWSMHFIGMLALKLPIRMAYDPTLTALSMIIGIVTSGFALAVVYRLAVISHTQVDKPVLVAGGVIMGAGICGMHYTGMAAMRMTPPIEYSPGLFLASMLIAVGASVVAVWLAFMLHAEAPRRRIVFRLLSAVVMGAAISGMHYTAMAAATFDPASICAVPSTFDVSDQQLAYGIAVTILAVLGLTLLLPLTASSGERTV